MKKQTEINRRGAQMAALLLAALAVLATAADCQKKVAVDNGKELKKLVVPYNAQGQGIPVLAIAHGLKYFEEEGLDIVLQPLNTGGNIDQLMAVSTGKIDLSNSVGTTAPLILIEQGNDLVIIGGTMAEGAALIAKPENVAQYDKFKPESLYGKKVGVNRASSGDLALRGWLYRQGADLSKISFIELGGYPVILEALRKGEVDVANVPTIWRITAENQGFPVFLHIDTLVPHFPCCRITTSRKNLDAQRADYVAFLRAMIRAYKFFSQEHEKSLDITSKYFDAGRETLENIYYLYGHYTHSPDPERERVLEFYQSMVTVGYGKGTGDVPSHIDSSLYQDALGQILAKNPGDPFYLELKKCFEENN